ncbi:DUF1566 domain-containing protein [Luminiphilus sp.]|nr:DUF1566 domain-containing protein [Luminiphilus sp.]
MRLLLLLAVLFPSFAFAGLVEVNSSQYLRESGNPQAQYLEVTLDNAGEIRVSNVNLQDGYIELASSTDVLLSGSSLMQPFSLPTGGSAVFPLEAGTHYLEVTLRGKPGGGLKVSFYEDKPDAPERGKGWELLDDGTVLNRGTGLIWHRNLATPGLSMESSSAGSMVMPDALSDDNNITSYITRLNNGDFGEDKIDGNAGYSDWRAPTFRELMSVLDYRTNPPLADANGDVGEPRVFNYGQSYFAGMLPGEPLIWCWNPDGEPDEFNGLIPKCEGHRQVYNFIVNEGVNIAYPNGGLSIGFWVDYQVVSGYTRGSVWPVRGGTPE